MVLWITTLKLCKKTSKEKDTKSISMPIKHHLLYIMLNTLKIISQIQAGGLYDYQTWTVQYLCNELSVHLTVCFC